VLVGFVENIIVVHIRVERADSSAIPWLEFM